MSREVVAAVEGFRISLRLLFNPKTHASQVVLTPHAALPYARPSELTVRRLLYYYEQLFL